MKRSWPLDFLSFYSVYCSTFYSLLRGSKVTFQFEKLLVYQKALDFADEVCTTTEQFSRGYGFLVDQLNRAALSISANIAEGNGRFTKADRRNFFIIARGSVQECVPLLELARRRSLIDDDRHSELSWIKSRITRRNRHF